MKKYYTPDKKEFYIGFEFESNYVLFNQKLTWKKIILNNSHNWFWDSYDEDAVETEFRVKYLDREDIESLGWKDTKNKGMAERNEEFLFTKSHAILKGDKYKLKYCSIIPSVQINNEGAKLFNGMIKNKSELKILMKQLFIN